MFSKTTNKQTIKQYGLVPRIDTSAGSCLTVDNWLDAGIKAVSFSLFSLLFKPGLNILQKLSSIHDFIGWPGVVIMDARFPVQSQDGVYLLRSPYDGSKLKLSIEEIVNLIHQLNPEFVYIPSEPSFFNCINHPPAAKKTIQICASDLEEEQDVCKIFSGINEFNSSLKNVESSKEQLSFTSVWYGDASINEMENMFDKGVMFLDSNQPANDALNGILYTEKGPLNITQEIMAEQFTVIEKECHCPTCAQQLSRAYLHYLFTHTHLLCHRFLIQHNIYFVQRKLLTARNNENNLIK